MDQGGSISASGFGPGSPILGGSKSAGTPAPKGWILWINGNGMTVFNEMTIVKVIYLFFREDSLTSGVNSKMAIGIQRSFWRHALTSYNPCNLN